MHRISQQYIIKQTRFIMYSSLLTTLTFILHLRSSLGPQFDVFVNCIHYLLAHCSRQLTVVLTSDLSPQSDLWIAHIFKLDIMLKHLRPSIITLLQLLICTIPIPQTLIILNRRYCFVLPIFPRVMFLHFCGLPTLYIFVDWLLFVSPYRAIFFFFIFSLICCFLFFGFSLIYFI